MAELELGGALVVNACNHDVGRLLFDAVEEGEASDVDAAEDDVRRGR